MDQKNFNFLKNLAKGITSVFGDRCEVVIHDLTTPLNSVIYVSNGFRFYGLLALLILRKVFSFMTISSLRFSNF